MLEEKEAELEEENKPEVVEEKEAALIEEKELDVEDYKEAEMVEVKDERVWRNSRLCWRRMR